MKHLILLFCLLQILGLKGQDLNRPKLVVGLVIDQMRWDYLYRYQDRYGRDGFKRLIREGLNCDNTLINFTPTYTGAGHASIFTGSVPALNGIMGNYWYDRSLKRNVYCTEDSTVTTVGSESTAGKMSPRLMWSSTVTDELRLATNFQNKTIAIAIKDRGSILPGGHTANAAYWFDNSTGVFITSSFYMKALPRWVNEFNALKLPDQFINGNWNTLYPLNTYRQSAADSNRYESKLIGEDNSFPHLTKDLGNRYEVFKYTPGGNTVTFEMAKAAIEGEQLGRSGHCDFLSVSLSSTDYAGHSFGPNSVEMEDMFLRLDMDMADFLKHLDNKIGKGQYLLFLTADHGVAHNPYFFIDHKLPAGTFEESRIKREINQLLDKEFGIKGLVETWMNYQVFLNKKIMAEQKIDRKKIVSVITEYLLTQPAISNVVDLEDLSLSNVQPQVKKMLFNGYNQRLSGDIQYIFKPQYFETWRTGSTHGAWNPYDSHIPLIWMGWKIKPGRLNREVYMEDIAPTISAMLRIQMPNASVGKVIEEAVRN